MADFSTIFPASILEPHWLIQARPKATEETGLETWLEHHQYLINCLHPQHGSDPANLHFPRRTFRLRGED